MVTNAGQVAYTATADQYHAVLLQIVTNAGDIASTLDLIGQADSRDLTQSLIRLLGRRGFDAQAYAALLRATLQDGRSRLFDDVFSSLADQLVDRRHGSTS